jgi:hypothetical protein
MTPTQKLLILDRYFRDSRQSGHTTAMMNGANESDCIVLANNQVGADFIKTLNPKCNVIAFSNIDHSLQGIRKPLLIDNAAAIDILETALSEIHRLEQKIQVMKWKAREIVFDETP